MDISNEDLPKGCHTWMFRPLPSRGGQMEMETLSVRVPN